MDDITRQTIERLLASPHPSIVYKTRVRVLGEDPAGAELQELRRQIADSALMRQLLGHRRPDGRQPANPYQKWQGPLWTMISVAEQGYPAGDTSLMPLLDAFYEYLFSPKHLLPPHTHILPGQEDRVRRCASMEANTVWSALKLGLADERTDELVRRLLRWQWPDGGWNCDRRPEAHKSSLHETVAPLRALALYETFHPGPAIRAAVEHAGEILLKRRLFRQERAGGIIEPGFLLLQYPYYWQYTAFYGLTVLAESGFVGDPRCEEALDLLESKRLPDGGFALEKRRFRLAAGVESNGSFADWGPTGLRRANPFVTVDALAILRAAGRL